LNLTDQIDCVGDTEGLLVGAEDVGDRNGDLVGFEVVGDNENFTNGDLEGEAVMMGDDDGMNE
jgi:hypothetical protein